MEDRSGLVPWTDLQWSRVSQAITEQANRTRVAAGVLPVFGSLPRSTEVVPRERLLGDGTVDDVSTINLLELSVEAKLSRQQVEEEDLGSAQSLFRWAASLVAQCEDWVIFNGPPSVGHKARYMHLLDESETAPPRSCRIRGGRVGVEGLLTRAGSGDEQPGLIEADISRGEELIPLIVDATSQLEEHGHVGPYGVFLGNTLFRYAYDPAEGSLVLPRDRIEPFIGGRLLRSSVLPPDEGVVVSLSGEPVDLVVAVDVAPQFLFIDQHARYVFQIYERFAPRIKDPRAVVQLRPTSHPPAPPVSTRRSGNR